MAHRPRLVSMWEVRGPCLLLHELVGCRRPKQEKLTDDARQRVYNAEALTSQLS